MDKLDNIADKNQRALFVLYIYFFWYQGHWGDCGDLVLNHT